MPKTGETERGRKGRQYRDRSPTDMVVDGNKAGARVRYGDDAARSAEAAVKRVVGRMFRQNTDRSNP